MWKQGISGSLTHGAVLLGPHRVTQQSSLLTLEAEAPPPIVELTDASVESALQRLPLPPPPPPLCFLSFRWLPASESWKDCAIIPSNA